MKIPYGKQTINDNDLESVLEVLKSDYLTTGPKVKEFEVQFAKKVSAKFGIAVSNGTAALHLAFLAMKTSDSSEVITTPITFAATTNSILYSNNKPVFSDITKNGLIDPKKIEEKISEKTIGIAPVDYMGLPADLEEIFDIARENNLFIVEDSCHALGAKYKGYSVGSNRYSDISIFSFHPVKHITTGEGGMITTNSKELYEKILQLRTHGITKDPSKFRNKSDGPWYHEMQLLGFNYRLTDFQAALGLSQLKRIEEFVNKRRKIAKIYNEFFNDIDDVEIINETRDKYHSYHLYVIKTKNTKQRLKLFKFLASNEVYCQIHYIPVYWHPYYSDLGYKKGLCPSAEIFYSKIISLPMYPSLSETELNYILDKLKYFFNNL